MLQQPYISGLERKRHEAFGIDLSPLTLGHVQILAEMESAIAFPGRPVELNDLGKLVFVVHYPQWEQAREDLAHPEYLNKVLTRITELSRDQIQAGVESCGAYLAYYKCTPDTDQPFQPWERQRVPWWWAYAEFMQSVMGRSEVDAWGTICSDAFVYWACYLTRNGDDTVNMHGDAEINIRIRQGMTIAEQFEKGLL